MRNNETQEKYRSALKKIELVCPFCGYKQEEAKSAISTFCRDCGKYYKIIDKKSFSNVPSFKLNFSELSDDFEDVSKIEVELEKPDYTSTTNNINTDTSNNNKVEESINRDGIDERVHQIEKSEKVGNSFKSSWGRKKILGNMKLFKNGEINVSCYSCDNEDIVSTKASSTMCSKCGTYISLKDHVVMGQSNIKIKTRGNVVVQKKAFLTSSSVFCNNLTVYGSITASVYCSGFVKIYKSCKINGEISCDYLYVENGVTLETSGEIRVENADIFGSVKGVVCVANSAKVSKKSKISGSIQAKKIHMETGAEVDGIMIIKG